MAGEVVPPIPEDERKRRVQRMVADKVTDKMLTTPVGELSDVEAAILMAALSGQFADEVMSRIKGLGRG